MGREHHLPGTAGQQRQRGHQVLGFVVQRQADHGRGTDALAAQVGTGRLDAAQQGGIVPLTARVADGGMTRALVRQFAQAVQQ